MTTKKTDSEKTKKPAAKPAVKPTAKPAAVKPVEPVTPVEPAAAEKEAIGEELIGDELSAELAELEVATPTGSEAKLKRADEKLVQKLQAHDKDTGSAEVQIALLTGKITDLVKHLKEHPKDHDSRHGLLKMVGRRRRLLRFLKAGREEQYLALIKELKLRK